MYFIIMVPQKRIWSWFLSQIPVLYAITLDSTPTGRGVDLFTHLIHESGS